MDEREKERLRANLPPFLLVVVMIVIMFATLMVTSCSPRVLESVRVERDTLVVVRNRVDSVVVRDSVYVREKGDTVFKYVERVRDRVSVRIDTVERVMERTDTLYETKVVEVERKMGRWERFKVDFGGLMLALVLFGAVFFGIYVYLGRRRG